MYGRLCVYVLVALLAGSGCGFHLRSYDLQAAIESVRIDSNGRNFLAEPLRQAFKQVGVDVGATEPDVVIVLLSEQNVRRGASVTSNARVAEYELALGVQYRILGGGGEELAPGQWVRVERFFRVNQDNIVGSSEEQALLTREMESDLVQQVLRTVNAVMQTGGGA